MEKVLKISESLPTAENIDLITQHEPEARYILQLAKKSLMQSAENSTESCSEKTLILLRALIDKTWERINIGHFSDVPLNIRKIYAVAIYFMIVFLLICNSDQETLEKCSELLDKALLVGCTTDLYRNNDVLLKDLTEFLTCSLEFFSCPLNLPVIEPLSRHDVAIEIPVVDCPSLEYFRENFFSKLKPVLLRQCIEHWPALTKWRDLNYFVKVAGNRTVPIELGSTYTTDDWSQDMTKLKDFLRRQFEGTETPTEVEYLAQHELFDQVPELKQDIRIPDYCCLSSTGNDPSVDIKAWLGPKGTISPMHHDPKHNILCQVFGHKKLILASSDDSEFVYPHEGSILSNTSQIDAENVDLDKFPLAERARFYHVTLQEGDCVYIPPKWWHYVRSMSRSFSVSFWWD